MDNKPKRFLLSSPWGNFFTSSKNNAIKLNFVVDDGAYASKVVLSVDDTLKRITAEVNKRELRRLHLPAQVNYINNVKKGL